MVSLQNIPEQPKVGIAIAVHNDIEHTRECLNAILSSDYSNLFTCVVDDGSTDGTWTALQDEYPWVKSVRGDGNLWWTGGTNLAICTCLEAGCEYVLLLNPDSIVYPETISHMVKIAGQNPHAVIAAVVVQAANPDTIWWAGTTWGAWKWFPLIWFIRYQYHAGQKVGELPVVPFQTADTGGRGVLIPRSIFETVGLFDEITFPHYAADNDFGLRVHEAGYNILIVPEAKVKLYIEQTGMAPVKTFGELWAGFMQRMFSRKHGEALHCLWHLHRKHTPWYAVAPSFMTGVLWGSGRYWLLSLNNIQEKLLSSYQDRYVD